MVNVTKDQLEKMGDLFENVQEYNELVKGHNQAKNEALGAFLDEVCPKPQGKMNPKEKETFKEMRKEASQWLKDSWREWSRSKDSKPDTTPEALITVENLLRK